MAPSEPSRVEIWPMRVQFQNGNSNAELYVQVGFQVPVFDFIFSHKNALYKVDRLIKDP